MSDVAEMGDPAVEVRGQVRFAVGVAAVLLLLVVASTAPAVARFFGSVQSETLWRFSAPRYGADGRGVYWVAEHGAGGDWEREIRYAAGVGSTSRRVRRLDRGVPPEIPSRLRAGSTRGSVSCVIGDSPSGRLTASARGEASLEDSAVLTVVDRRTGETLRTHRWKDGRVDSVEWLTEEAVLVARSKCERGSARLELIRLDNPSELLIIQVLPGTGGTPSIDRIVADPEGFAVFSVSMSSGGSRSPLYRFDARALSIGSAGQVPSGGNWDFSPERDTVVTTGGPEDAPLEERLLDPVYVAAAGGARAPWEH